MSRSDKRARVTKKLPLWISVSLIALLSAVAIALSYLALTEGGSAEHPGLPVKPEAATFEGDVTPASASPIEAQPEPGDEQLEEPITQRMVAMVSSVAMRATAGTCENPSTVEISLDEAQSWSTTQSLAEAGATQILRLLPTSPTLVQVVALDSNCEPQVYRSADLGTTWEGPLPVVDTWYLDPSTPAQVEAPGGPQPLPCEAAELAPAGDRAAVRCIDGSIVTTVDRGVNWSGSPEVTEALAINYSPDSYVVAQVGDPTCEGLFITTLVGSPSPALDGCFETPTAADANNAENIAIAQSGMSTLLLWVGDDVVISTDGGEAWL